jgi:hypothetical protein
MLGEDDEKPDVVRVELSTDEDLFFHYIHKIDNSGFDHMRSKQKLMIPFEKYSTILIQTLNNCIKQPETYMSVLYINDGGTGKLDFIQNMEYKFVDLLSVRFIKSPAEFVKQMITFRFLSMKSELKKFQAKLAGVNNLIKARNPSLMLHLNRLNSPTKAIIRS